MTTPLPEWAPSLELAFETNPDAGFRWLAPDVAAKALELLLSDFDQVPYDDEFQESSRERIRRSRILAVGPSRTVRLTQRQQAIVLLYDPEHPDRVFASLGSNLPPLLWPSAEPTLAGLQRDLAPYLAPAWKSRAALRRSVRIIRGSRRDLGVESVDQFAELIAKVEPWLDGHATWGSACDDDPWPEDPARCSMLELRVIGERSAEQHSGRNRSVAMRSLWSRSILVIEQGPFDAVIVELRYDPAPLVARLPAEDGHLRVPDDLPVDLLASLIRGASTTLASLDEARVEGVTPYVAMVVGALDAGEVSTIDLLRELATHTEHREHAAAFAADLGAESLLFELCTDESTEPSLREKIAGWVMPSPPESAAEDADNDEDQDDNEEEVS